MSCGSEKFANFLTKLLNFLVDSPSLSFCITVMSSFGAAAHLDKTCSSVAINLVSLSCWSGKDQLWCLHAIHKYCRFRVRCKRYFRRGHCRCFYVLVSGPTPCVGGGYLSSMDYVVGSVFVLPQCVLRNWWAFKWLKFGIAIRILALLLVIIPSL